MSIPDFHFSVFWLTNISVTKKTGKRTLLHVSRLWSKLFFKSICNTFHRTKLTESAFIREKWRSALFWFRNGCRQLKDKTSAISWSTPLTTEIIKTTLWLYDYIWFMIIKTTLWLYDYIWFMIIKTTLCIFFLHFFLTNKPAYKNLEN